MKKLIPCLILVVVGSCTLDDPRIAIDSREIITLTPIDKDFNAIQGIPKLKADSISHALILVNLGPKSDAGREITFNTTAGVLTSVGQRPTSSSSSSLTITPQDRQVVIQLNALDVASEEVIISGTNNNVLGVTKFTLETAFATDFQIQPTNAIIGKADTLEISLLAITGSGSISENQYCEVSATSVDGVVITHPQFVKISNQKGKFKITNISEKIGKINLMIKMHTAENSIKEKTVVIEYK